jgi:adenylate cyclase
MLEIERKFLVLGEWPRGDDVARIRQIYINAGGQVSVRLREQDGLYTITLKAGVKVGVRREFEIDVPAATGAAIMQTMTEAPPIEKKRTRVPIGKHVWEVDHFSGLNSGLVLAEVELDHEDELLELPSWVGPEVTADPRFTNHALFRNPFGRWGLAMTDLAKQLG